VESVPVTAKLSKHFYDVLGEDVANELVEWFNSVDATYRSDLRELNEMNFVRFDAKLEQRTAQLDAKIDQRIAEVKAELRQEIAGLRTEMREGFASIRGEMRVSAQELKADLLKWMFGACATLLGAMIALIKLG
jgi:hypothetical protein